jgi:hypothetical protein
MRPLLRNVKMRARTLDTAVIDKIMNLHRGEIPQHLKQKGVRTGNEFDPNSYFDVLTHIAMKPGYMLDYVYAYKFEFAGRPLLYAHPIGERSLEKVTEHRKWEKENTLLSFLITDGSPDGFFQLAVFQRLAGQFYLSGHAHYNDTMVIKSNTDVEEIISNVTCKWFGMNLTDEQITVIHSIPAEPCVEFTDSIAFVSYCIFTMWGGFDRLDEAYNLIAPHNLVRQEILYHVKYDCYVSF